MSFSSKPLLLVSLLAVIGASSALAQTAAPAAPAPAAPAAAAAPENSLSYNVGVVTDYRYRGISQSRLKPAVQGGIDFSHTSGLYVGTWASSIQWVKDAG
ncbi:MAG: TorF family putative porin, partial [Burkholderiaceae bacterium]|nr:TorF family putative porin [Burkholderiaceae bacterium]